MQPNSTLSVTSRPICKERSSKAGQSIGEALIGCAPAADLHMHDPLWLVGQLRLRPVFVCQHSLGPGSSAPHVLACLIQARVRYRSLTNVILCAESLLNTDSLTGRHVVESPFGCGDPCSRSSQIHRLPAAW